MNPKHGILYPLSSSMLRCLAFITQTYLFMSISRQTHYDDNVALQDHLVKLLDQ